MLKVVNGDMFTATLNQNCVVVHGCNAQGKMGSGVAAIVKKLYPMAELKYRQVYKRSGLKLGQVIWVPPELDRPGVTIANAITQQFYGYDGRLYVSYDAVIESLEEVKKLAAGKPIHLPFIGGKRGGGDKKRLMAIFQAVFHDGDATLWLHDDEEV